MLANCKFNRKQNLADEPDIASEPDHHEIDEYTFLVSPSILNVPKDKKKVKYVFTSQDSNVRNYSHDQIRHIFHSEEKETCVKPLEFR